MKTKITFCVESPYFWYRYTIKAFRFIKESVFASFALRAFYVPIYLQCIPLLCAPGYYFYVHCYVHQGIIIFTFNSHRVKRFNLCFGFEKRVCKRHTSSARATLCATHVFQSEQNDNENNLYIKPVFLCHVYTFNVLSCVTQEKKEGIAIYLRLASSKI